ncbi:MAG: SpaA isopeptide-forming pilin-related protein, partial [Salibacteraceae bacterium]|nr:SpaA isopeptide-forming pilin-related protein [Salibacteraceae bacterium]
MESRGGEGQEDLYISIKTDGKWSRPEWMGSNINSPGYEISPMLVKDNKVLLFASSGHNGLGDCDIFYAVRQDSTFTNWSEPVNLGAPVNSSRFDGFPFLVKDELYFTSNRADTFSDIYLSINTLFFEEADTMRLAFQMFVSQLNDVELTVKDQAGQTIGNYFSGSDGVVNIGGLSQNTDYLLYPSHADVEMSLFSPYMLNEKGEMIQQLNQNSDGSIAAKALSKEEIQSKEIMARPAFAAGMQGVYELENVPVRNVLLALVDQNGKPVQYSKTDNQGKFAFANTDDSLKLSIKVLSQLEYLKENGIIYFTDAKGKKLFKAKAIDTGTFAYQKLEAQQLAQLKMLQQVDKSKPGESKGVYKYKNLPKEGVVLHLYDENDQIIETVTTDENGEFIFTKLLPNQAFKIKPADEEDGGGSFLALYDNDGEEMDLFSRSIDGTGGFDYKPLSSDVVWGLTLNAYEDAGMSYNEPQNMVFSTGLFKFQNLPREGVKLKLLDENDNVIETVTTDANGQFVFSMLRNDKKYRIEVESLNNEQVDQSQIYFVGQEGDVTTAKSIGDKSFAFDELNPDYFFSISEVNEGKTELMLTESFKDVSGKFKYQNLPKEGVKLYLVDENGNVIETVYTDADGNFKFNKLAREKNYVIRLSEEDGGMMDQSAFVMTNEENEELEQEMDASGEFSFKTLPKQASKLTAQDLTDGPGLN